MLFLLTQKLLHIFKKFLTHFNGDYVLIGSLYKKNKFQFLLFVHLIIPLIPLMAIENRDFLLINTLVKSCYRDIKSCNQALLKINDYQINAAKNKKFSCQTRLLGLEANLIMAMNSDFKRKQSKNILDAIKKYC